MTLKKKMKHKKLRDSLTNPEGTFKITIYVKETGETFILNKLTNSTTIKEIKSKAEIATGIPYNMQRIHYLDEGDLLDSSDLKHNDIVPGAQLTLHVWDTWKTLVEAAAKNNIDEVLKLGTTQDTPYDTPNSNYMSDEKRKKWAAERAGFGLFISAHRGHDKLVKKLIDSGAKVNAATELGRTSLHIAAARNKGDIIDLLLEKGADIDAIDKSGKNALNIAELHGHKSCERHLFLFRWQQRAKKASKKLESLTDVSKPSDTTVTGLATHTADDLPSDGRGTVKDSQPMFAHQYFDSATPVWLKGTQAQIYLTQILPPGEFGGTALNAPRRLFQTSSGSLLPKLDARNSRFSSRKSHSAKESQTFEQWLTNKEKIEYQKKFIEREKKLEKLKASRNDRRQCGGELDGDKDMRGRADATGEWNAHLANTAAAGDSYGLDTYGVDTWTASPPRGADPKLVREARRADTTLAPPAQRRLTSHATLQSKGATRGGGSLDWNSLSAYERWFIRPDYGLLKRIKVERMPTLIDKY